LISLGKRKTSTAMIAAGYLYKLVARRPDWLSGAPHVQRIQSVSECISANFADYIAHWKHNGYWLFDSPDTMHDIARESGIDIGPMTLFYYEVFCQEFDEVSKAWSVFAADGPVHVVVPVNPVLLGFDVVCFSQRNTPECSPLSCNQLCEKVTVNAGCLFSTFDAAKGALEAGVFDHSEPGPFRVFAVYTVAAGGAERLVRSQSV
jgi:hypothetical protein